MRETLCALPKTPARDYIRIISSSVLQMALFYFLISSVILLMHKRIHFFSALTVALGALTELGKVASSQSAWVGLARALCPGRWLSSGGHLLCGCRHLPGPYQSRGQRDRTELNGPEGSTAQSQVKGSARRKKPSFTKGPALTGGAVSSREASLARGPECLGHHVGLSAVI